ncbi:MAG TPA: type II secretion system protein [Planctomycetota bacterium]|nr:type II secretion system protein [Planctomycetota bacterium]
MPATPDAPRRPPRTFRLLEVLVGMSIVVTLAGMLVPYSVRVGERTALARAAQDLATIAASYSAVNATQATWLRGAGEPPAGSPEPIAASSALVDRLSLPSSLDHRKRTALLLALQPDPWGSAYLVFLDAPGAVPCGSLVVSAGPDRALHTSDDLSQPIP